MPLTLTLDPHGEELVAAHLAVERKKTPAESIAHIRQSRKGVTLGGLKIKDLIHEGHRY